MRKRIYYSFNGFGFLLAIFGKVFDMNVLKWIGLSLIAGLCLTHVKYDNMPTRYEDGGFIAVENETRIGAAAGVGVDLTIIPHLILNAQGLYQIVKNNHQGVFSIGVIYKF